MSGGLFAEKPQGYDWIQWYYDWALKPFAVNQRIARFLWEIHGAQLDYWLEAQKAQKLIEETAYYISEEIGQQHKKSLDFWVAAEKYMGSLAALSAKFLNSGFNNQEILDQFLEVFPAKNYSRKVEELAQIMSRYAGQQTQIMIPTSYFWPAAEYHIITLIAGAVATARTFQDAATSLTRIANFSADRYLKFIREAAYYRWKKAGEPYGEPLRYWLESESEILAQLQQGEMINDFTSSSPQSRSDADDVYETSPENKGTGVYSPVV